MSKDRSIGRGHDRKYLVKPFVIENLAKQTSILPNLLTEEVTNSGSFDIRGDIWATTFGNLLKALPIPSMLLDKSFNIIAVNQACCRISPQYKSILNTRFSSLFLSSSKDGGMQSIVMEAFATRKPTVVQTSLRIGSGEAIWCRMTFRSIRIGLERFLLLLIEDFSFEKKLLSQNDARQVELRQSRRELEEKLGELKEQIEQLCQIAKHQHNGITSSRKAERSLKDIVSTVEDQLREVKEEIIARLRLSLQPLIDQLKAETASESGRQLLKALDYHLANAFASLGGKPMRELALLTPREIQVCNLIASGLTSKQIAGAMKVTVDAVYSHRLHIRKKLGLDLSGEPLATWLKFQYGL